MEWLPPSLDGIAMCQESGVYSHDTERTAIYGYDDRCGLGKVCFSGARCVDGGRVEVSEETDAATVRKVHD